MGVYQPTVVEMMNDYGLKLDDAGFNKFGEIVLGDYPIWSESYRSRLNMIIMRHFMFNERGMETFYSWRLTMETRMKEIMPYYNQLYEQTLDGHDIFEDTDYYKDYEGKTNDKEHSKTTGSSDMSDSKSDQYRDETDEIHNNEGSKDSTKGTTYNDDTISNSNKEYTEGIIHTKTEEYLNDKKTVSKDSGSDTNSRETTPSITKHSDTPQGEIDDILAGKYLSDVTEVVANGKGEDKVTYGKNNTTTETPSDKRTTDTPSGTKNITGEDGTVNKTGKSNETYHEDWDEKGTADRDFVHSGSSSESQTVETEKEGDLSRDTQKTSQDHVHGKMNSGKSYMQMLKEWRDILLNIDMMIIDDLEECFMMIY